MKKYLADYDVTQANGACEASQIVLELCREALAKAKIYDEELQRYAAEIYVDRWENGREQGFVISLRNLKFIQLNIAFFEHRNSDDICAVNFKLSTLNSPTVHDFPESHPYYSDKWAVDKQVDYNEHQQLADWIVDKLKTHWVASIDL